MFHTVRIEPITDGVLHGVMLTFLSLPGTPCKAFDTLAEAVAYLYDCERAEEMRKARRIAAYESTTSLNAINLD